MRPRESAASPEPLVFDIVTGTNNICTPSNKLVLYDFLATVNAAPHECVIRTGQP